MTGQQQWRLHSEYLIGVIDLKGGVAVHGIAGNRGQYAAVRPLWRDTQPADGDPVALLAWYRQFDLRNFYIADIDALQGGRIQRDTIATLLAHGGPTDRWMIDVGVSDKSFDSQTQWMREMHALYPMVRWIVASEAATSTSIIERVTDRIAAKSLVLGIDFRGGQFVGPDSGIEPWVAMADQAGMRSGLLLDVAAVGTGRGPQTREHCVSFNQRFPEWRWISGGGCRDVADVDAFLQSGCSGCLIASALLPTSD